MTAPIGPYSPVVRAGPWLVCSGQLGVIDGRLSDEGVAGQTTQALVNLASLLATEDAMLSDVVKTTVFLTDMTDFAAMNEAYGRAFAGHRPARSSVAVVALPLGAGVEIEAWAYKPQRD